jgi:hypothetical protein
MKTTKIILAAVIALAGEFSAGAQANAVPGDTDYAKFSQFVTERNIFDPNRFPRTTRTTTSRYQRPTRTTRRTSGAPAFTFVGSMTYQKGLFAFFDGNSSDLKKVLALNGDVAGYTVKAISQGSVKIQGADKKEIEMKIGDQMRQEGGHWQLAGAGEAVSLSAPSTENSSNPAEAPPAASSANLEGNDILKKLMEKRAKENQ